MTTRRNLYTGIARVVILILATLFSLKLAVFAFICGAITVSAFATSHQAAAYMALIATVILGACGCFTLFGGIVFACSSGTPRTMTDTHKITFADRLAGALIAACGASLVALIAGLFVMRGDYGWAGSFLAFSSILATGTALGYAFPDFGGDFADSVFSFFESILT